MRDEWSEDWSWGDHGNKVWSRRAVVFRVRCIECGRLAGEYQVTVTDDGDFVGGVGGSMAKRLEDALTWVRFDPNDYTTGLSNRSEKKGILKIAPMCSEHEWEVAPTLRASDLRKGIAFLDDLHDYDDALSHMLRWNSKDRAYQDEGPLSEREKEVLAREPYNWSEIGVQVKCEPTGLYENTTEPTPDPWGDEPPF